MRLTTSTFVLLSCVGLPSCTQSTKVACDCTAQSVGVVIHAAGGAISGIALAGPACLDAGLRCIPHDVSAVFEPGCEEYQVLPLHAGECDVTIMLADGRRQSEQTTIVDRTAQECCGGFFAARPEDTDITVGVDAGSPD